MQQDLISRSGLLHNLAFCGKCRPSNLISTMTSQVFIANDMRDLAITALLQ